MVHQALAAAEALAREEIRCEVVDLRTVKPLDTATVLTSVRKTGRLVIVHEAVRTGGIGGEIAAIAAEEAFTSLKAPIRRVTAPDTPVPFSPPLEEFYTPDPEQIMTAVRSVCSYR
jgi:pyruvate dehydrogenase E1 component beta subunit